MKHEMELLKRCGQALYGRAWQTSLADDLGISSRLMRYWVKGETGLPSDLSGRLKSILTERKHLIASLIREISG